MKFKVDKLGIVKLVNVRGSLNTLIAKVDDLDVDKLKTAPVGFKKVSDVESKQFIKVMVYNILNLKV